MTFMGTDGIISIDYDKMNQVKKNLKRARDGNAEVLKRINNAKTKLQVIKGSTRIRDATDQLIDYSRQLLKTQNNLDQMINKVDYIVRRVKETDAKCAARIKAIGSSTPKKKNIFGQLEDSFLQFEGALKSEAVSIWDEGKKFYESLRGEGTEFYNREVSFLNSAKESIADNRVLGLIEDGAKLEGLSMLMAISTDKNFLKEAPTLMKLYETNIMDDGIAIWNSLHKNDPSITKFADSVYKDSIAIKNTITSNVEEAWEDYKKIDPIKAGIVAGTYDFIKSTAEGIIGLTYKAGKEYYNYKRDPVETLNNVIKVGENVAQFISTLPENKDAYEAEIKQYINKTIDEKIVNGDAYTRSEFLTDVVLNIGSLFVGAEELKAASGIGKLSDVGKIEEVADISKIEKINSEVVDTVDRALRTKLDDINSEVVGKFDSEGRVQQSDIEKYVSDMKNAYANSSITDRGDILVPESAEYLKNPPIALDADGRPYSDPNYKWPPNNGFKGKPSEVTPCIGNEFDRVGSENGRFVSPIKGETIIPKENRALPYHFTEENIANEPSYNRYKVTRNFNELEDAIRGYNNPKLSIEENEVMREEFMTEYKRNTRTSDTYTHEPGKTYSGEIADAFKDGDGGGTQWELPMSVDSLKQLGMIDYK